MAPKEAKLPSRPAVQLKTPKGTRDWTGADLILREQVFTTISNVFKAHGGTPLDTPVFELKEILAGKYGEDSRLMYDLQDQGGELCSLRFDLTVPFARWLAMNSVTQFKRYQIAKVYRRDQPAIQRGRLREFHQCDFDIAGVYDPMIPDAEILRIVVEVFQAIDQPITIKLNHRRILDGLFAAVGVPSDKIRPISSAVDKLDKAPWAEVKQEMVEQKGLDEAVADQIGEYVRHSGTIAEMIDYIKSNDKLAANDDIQAGLADMELLQSYLGAFGIVDKVLFDMSLARGLDYYTGVIFEVITKLPGSGGAPAAAAGGGKGKKGKDDDPASQVGSIAAGGRYDNLVGMYGKRTIPCVGISFGVDRVITVLKARREKEAQALKAREVDVYVMAFGGKEFDGLLLERMAVCSRLWDAGIRAEFTAKVKARLPSQFKAAEGVPVGVILGEDEVARGEVRVKMLSTGDASGGDSDKDRGSLVKNEDLVTEVKRLLAQAAVE